MWLAFSKTIVGDVLSTAVAIGGVCLLFLAGSFAVLYLSRAYHVVAHLLVAK